MKIIELQQNGAAHRAAPFFIDTPVRADTLTPYSHTLRRQCAATGLFPLTLLRKKISMMQKKQTKASMRKLLA